ncbi:MAG: hypothetical protein ACK58N_13230 [Synechocystis sp.]|jgi:hypothetical protein
MKIITKEAIKQGIDHLNDEQLKQLSDFIAFIKFQSKLKPILGKLVS